MTSGYFPVVQLQTLEIVNASRRLPLVGRPSSEGVLLVPVRGSSLLGYAGREWVFKPGRCYLLAAGRPFTVERPASGMLDYYCLTFATGAGTGDAQLSESFALEPFEGEYRPKPFSQCLDTLDRMHRLVRGRPNELERFRASVMFQELLLYLFQRGPAEEGREPASAQEAVEASIIHMRQCWRSDVQIQELAAMTGLGRGQYIRLFKDATGKTPMAYLADLRLDRAKRLLLSSDASLRDIAQSLGFKDEYYFNRKFKRLTGVSPGRFRAEKRSSLKVAAFHYFGELLALDLKPVAIDKAMSRLFETEARGLPAVDEYWEEEEWSGLRPDLILYPDFMGSSCPSGLDSVPAVEIDWKTDVFKRLRAIGELTGRTAEAAAWIDRYRQRSLQTRARLASCMREGETAAAFAFHRDSLYVYGAHHAGYTLYRGLGFAPPSEVGRLIGGDDRFTWLEIPASSLSRYAGDRVFLVVTEPERGRRGAEELIRSSHWTELEAVRSGRAYMLEERFAYYNPITLDRNLDEIVPVLQHS